MTTSVLDRVPVDQIAERAHAVPFWRTVFHLVTFVPFALGWLAAKAFGILWLALAWLWASLCEGWESAHGPSRKQVLARQAAEIRELKTQLGRFGE